MEVQLTPAQTNFIRDAIENGRLQCEEEAVRELWHSGKSASGAAWRYWRQSIKLDSIWLFQAALERMEPEPRHTHILNSQRGIEARQNIAELHHMLGDDAAR
jgi:hypothetical protein